jgi:hypothetical protein
VTSVSGPGNFQSMITRPQFANLSMIRPRLLQLIGTLLDACLPVSASAASDCLWLMSNVLQTRRMGRADCGPHHGRNSPRPVGRSS